MQMSALLEEQRTGHKCALRHHNDTTTLAGTTVNNSLNLLGLHLTATHQHTIVRKNVATAKLTDVDLLWILEPCIHLCTVGPGLYSLLSLGFSCN